jgi:tetratricopeptide (TPR) repeat protein
MLLMNDTEDPAKADVYNSLSDEYIQLDYNRSAEYSILAYDLSKKLEYHQGLMKASMALANLNMGYFMDFNKANAYYHEALPLAQALKDRHSEMIIYRGFSYVQRESENLELAMEYNEKAMEIARELDSYMYQSDLNAYMGGLLEQKGDTAAAIDAYAEVLALERENDFTETSNASMIAIARYYYLIKDPGQSLKYYRIALKNFERTQDLRWTSYTHSEMAHLYVYKGDLKRAEKHAIKGLDLALQNKLTKETGDNYKALVVIYTAMDSTHKADYYAKALDSLLLASKPLQESPAPVDSADEKSGAAPVEKTNGFLQALIIMIPVVLLILLAGRPRKKK